MSEVKKIFYLVNDGAQLSAYKIDGNAPWFVIEAAKCDGGMVEFNEAVKFIRVAFGPLADYKELRQPQLPGIKT